MKGKSMTVLNEEQSAALGKLSRAIPATCDQDGMAHERGSAYCDDHDSEVPGLLNDLVCDVAEYPTAGEHDRAAAFLYGKSPELRAVVAAYFAEGYDPYQLSLVSAALERAALDAVTGKGSFRS